MKYTKQVLGAFVILALTWCQPVQAIIISIDAAAALIPPDSDCTKELKRSGKCSVTTATSCRVDGDCPGGGGETCVYNSEYYVVKCADAATNPVFFLQGFYFPPGASIVHWDANIWYETDDTDFQRCGWDVDWNALTPYSVVNTLYTSNPCTIWESSVTHAADTRYRAIGCDSGGTVRDIGTSAACAGTACERAEVKTRVKLRADQTTIDVCEFRTLDINVNP